MNDRIRIAPRFCGPPGCGNGGYVCGLLARHIEAPVQAKLLRPVPLGVDLTLEKLSDKDFVLRHKTQILVEAHVSALELHAPACPSFEDAVTASKNYIGLREHPFPNCFVCGPGRRLDDGLRIFAGPVENDSLLAAPWVPKNLPSDEGGNIRSEYVWAALDCPGAFTVSKEEARPLVLGTFAAAIAHPIKLADRYIVVGWKLGEDGRKFYAGTALLTEHGTLCAKAKATWIALRSPAARQS